MNTRRPPPSRASPARYVPPSKGSAEEIAKHYRRQYLDSGSRAGGTEARRPRYPFRVEPRPPAPVVALPKTKSTRGYEFQSPRASGNRVELLRPPSVQHLSYGSWDNSLPVSVAPVRATNKRTNPWIPAWVDTKSMRESDLDHPPHYWLSKQVGESLFATERPGEKPRVARATGTGGPNRASRSQKPTEVGRATTEPPKNFWAGLLSR